MCIYFCEWNETNPMLEHWILMRPRPAGSSALDEHQIQSKSFDLSHFRSKGKCKYISLIHTWQKNKIICFGSWKIMNKLAWNVMNMKNINTLRPSKNKNMFSILVVFLKKGRRRGFFFKETALISKYSYLTKHLISSIWHCEWYLKKRRHFLFCCFGR